MLSIGFDAGGGGLDWTDSVVCKEEGVAYSKVYTIIGVKGTRKM